MRAAWEALAGVVMGGLGLLPMWTVRVLVIGVFVALAAWAMSLPRAYSMKGAPGKEWYLDVRIWAVVVIGLEILPYVFF